MFGGGGAFNDHPATLLQHDDPAHDCSTWRTQEIFQKAYLASQAQMIARRGWRAGFSSASRL
jgi:hypothetical protein